MNSNFSQEVIKEWEEDDGVNFAVALSRLTGWIIQVEWIATSKNEKDKKGLIPLRVNVADNKNLIFDISGIYTIEDYYNAIVFPLIEQRNTFSNAGCVCRYYAESRLQELPLRFKPDDKKIEKALSLIQTNKRYLSKIPLRNKPQVPANQAAIFTFGKCNPFSEAIYSSMKIKPIALIAKKYTRLFSDSRLGYVHSFNQIDDKTGLDVWGIDSIENIAKRFGISEFELSSSAHAEVTAKLKNSSPEAYVKYYHEAMEIIDKYFNELH